MLEIIINTSRNAIEDYTKVPSDLDPEKTMPTG
jgi:hypothetical protein